jgi:hypothetical protein
MLCVALGDLCKYFYKVIWQLLGMYNCGMKIYAMHSVLPVKELNR